MHKSILLSNRICAGSIARGNPLVRVQIGNSCTSTRCTVEYPAVVAALHRIAHDTAKGQGDPSVRTPVLKR
jgi:hypothetical protein